MAFNILPTKDKEKTQDSEHVKTGAAPSFKRLGRLLYKLSYLTGKNALTLVHKVSCGGASVLNVVLSEIFRGAGDFARNLSEFKRSRPGRGEISFTRGIINAGAGVSETLHNCLEAFRRDGFRSGLAVAGRFVRHTAAHFFAEKKAVLNYIAPIAAVSVLAVTVYFWSGACFAIAVTNGGKSLGVVASEKIYRNAADKVEQNVSDASGSNFKLDSKVTFKMVLAKKADLSDEDQIYNNIVMKSCSGVKTGYGLYVDNRLAGAASGSGTIEAMLNNMTAKYKKDPQVQSVGFSQDVAVRNGVFPSSVFKTAKQIKSVITAKNTSGSGDKGASSASTSGIFRISLDPLYVMNLSTDTAVNQDETIETGSSQPTLTLKVVKNESYTQFVSYQVIKIKSDKLLKGKAVIGVKGKKGTQQVVAAVTYEGGVKTAADVISTTVTKKAVAEKILVGTKTPTSSDGASTTTISPGNTDGISGYSQTALGVPYVMGGISYSGFDCSGLTKYMFAKYGVYLPHSAAAQSAYGSYVSRSSLQTGDLVFFDTNGGHNSISHVGIYLGGGNFIDASSARPHCVKIDSLYSNYYSNRFMTARRVLK